jgi:hypothetical protein
MTTTGKGGASPLLVVAYDTVTRIQHARCDRWMSLQIKFPAMHYVTLSLLAMAICISFLVATDQSLVIFESLQVRILWTILIGSFTSLAVVCYDLSSPFVGAYQVRIPGEIFWQFGNVAHLFIIFMFLSVKIVSKVADDELSVFYDQ